MTDKSGTSTAATESWDSTNSRVQMKVPANGYYNTNAYLYSAGSNFGNATAAQVLTGRTFTSTAGLKATGSMTNNGGVSGSVGVGGTYTIAKGYHDGSGKVTGPTAANKTITLTASQTGNSTHTYNAAVGTVTVNASAVYNAGRSANNLTYIESFGERTTKTFNDTQYKAYLFVVSATEKYRLDRAISSSSGGGTKTEIVTSFVSGYGTGVRVFRIERTSAITLTTGDATDWAAFGIK